MGLQCVLKPGFDENFRGVSRSSELLTIDKLRDWEEKKALITSFHDSNTLSGCQSYNFSIDFLSLCQSVFHIKN
jgi:hypothetical protein